MSKIVETKEYKVFLMEITEKVYASQYQAMMQVNKALIGLYWDIGQEIVQKQKTHGWGKSVVEKLSEDLQKEFPGMQGWSGANLWRMRKFYLTYQDDSKLALAVREIAWGHNVVIFERIKEPVERHFYIVMSQRYGWTRNVLEHQIDIGVHEKYALSQTNFDKALPDDIRHQAKLAVKDDYNFDFWNSVKTTGKGSWS